MLKKLTLVAITLIGVNGYSQNQAGFCGTKSAEQQILSRTDISESEKNQLLQEQARYEEEINKRAEALYNNRFQKDEQVFVIPVVFHVFHNFGPENISDAQIYDQLRIMNEEFNKKNAKLNQVVPEFQSIIGDIKVEFRLATLDPQGNCTNGINRYVHPDPYFTSKGPIDILKTQVIWPRARYLNCFVVGSIETSSTGTILGYAQFPGFGSANTDGLVMVHYGIGSIGTGSSNNQSVSTHEIGHWLGLRHTWGDCAEAGDPAACNCDDGITDTPVTLGSPSTCNLGESRCGPLANVQNFMDYSFCYAMFTEGQKAKMRATLQSGTASRNNLWTATNLALTGANYTTTPTVLCKADFLPKSNKPICTGSTVDFVDHSFYNVQTWNWEFEGGTPATSTEQHPSVTYNTPGTFKATLTVSDGVNTYTTTKENQVTVLTDNLLGNTYSQTFETISLQTNSDFKVNNPDNDKTWVIKDGVAYEGNRSVYLQNRLVTGADKIDELVSNTFDFTNIPAPTLKFKYAHAGKTTASADELIIYLSNDCGVTWNKVRTLKGSLLKTAPDAPTVDFVPTSSQWKEYTYSISSTYRKAGVRVKFAWVNGGGNNIYLDNINIADASIGIKDHLANNFSLSVFPNPMDESAEVSFQTVSTAKISVELFDLVGKKAKTVYAGTLPAGEHAYPVNSHGLNSGVYFIKLTVDNNSFTRKVIIK